MNTGLESKNRAPEGPEGARDTFPNPRGKSSTKQLPHTARLLCMLPSPQDCFITSCFLQPRHAGEHRQLAVPWRVDKPQRAIPSRIAKSCHLAGAAEQEGMAGPQAMPTLPQPKGTRQAAGVWLRQRGAAVPFQSAQRLPRAAVPHGAASPGGRTPPLRPQNARPPRSPTPPPGPPPSHRRRPRPSAPWKRLEPPLPRADWLSPEAAPAVPPLLPTACWGAGPELMSRGVRSIPGSAPEAESSVPAPGPALSRVPASPQLQPRQSQPQGTTQQKETQDPHRENQSLHITAPAPPPLLSNTIPTHVNYRLQSPDEKCMHVYSNPQPT